MFGPYIFIFLLFHKGTFIIYGRGRTGDFEEGATYFWQVAYGCREQIPINDVNIEENKIEENNEILLKLQALNRGSLNPSTSTVQWTGIKRRKIPGKGAQPEKS